MTRQFSIHDLQSLFARRAWRLGVFSLLLFSMGCYQPRMPRVDSAGLSELSKGYALLYELTSKQSGLDKSLIMGGMSEESKALVRDIAAESKAAAERIKSFSGADTSLVLEQKSLPVAEGKSREAQESAATGRLLFAGKKFELRLLLTQVDALQYGSLLAREVAKLDDRDDRKKWLAEFAKKYEELHGRVEGRLAIKGKE